MKIIKEIFILPIIILSMISLIGAMALPILLPMLLIVKSYTLLFFAIMGIIGIIIVFRKDSLWQ